MGILAAVAVPKYLNMTTNARTGILRAAQAVLTSTSYTAHMDYIATGSTASSLTADDGASIPLAYGYPTAVAGFATTAGLDPSSYTATAAAGILTIKVIGASDPVTCSVTYTQAADAATPPVISALSFSGC